MRIGKCSVGFLISSVTLSTAMLICLALAGNGDSSSNRSSSSSDTTVSDMASSGASSVQNNIIATSTGSTTAVANNSIISIKDRFFASVKSFHPGTTLYAATTVYTMPDGSSIAYSDQPIDIKNGNLDPWNTSGLLEFSVVNVLTSAENKAETVSITGTTSNTWSVLSGSGSQYGSASGSTAGMIQENTLLCRFQSVTKTKLSDNSSVTVKPYSGTGALSETVYGVSTNGGTLVSGTPLTWTRSGTGAVQNVNMTMLFSSAASQSKQSTTYTVNIAEEQTGGTNNFDHIVTTPTALSVTDTLTAGIPQTRVITSGSVQVYHVKAGLTMQAIYSSVKFDMTQTPAMPFSGSIIISVTNIGGNSAQDKYVGTGTITINRDGSYSCVFTPTGSTASTTTLDVPILSM